MLNYLQQLAGRRRFGMKPGLDTIRALLERLGHPEREIAAILAQVNNFLVREIQEDRFVTLFYARYEVATRQISYASAGHPPAYVVDRHGRLKARLVSTGSSRPQPLRR